MTVDNTAISLNISLRVMGKNLEPNEVTRQLGLSPSYCHSRGDANVSSSGRYLGERSEGIWTFDIAGVSIKNVDDHLKTLTQMLIGKQVVMETFGENGYRKDVLIGIFGVSEPLGFSICAGTLATLGSLGLHIDFDIYVD